MTSTALQTAYPILSNGAAFAPRPGAKIITLSGPDAERYLQGRITQDIAGLSAGQGTQSLLLNPQGRIHGLFYLLKNPDSFLLCSHSTLDDEASLCEALLRFKVADQVDVQSRSAEVSVLAVLGTKAASVLSSVFGNDMPAEELNHSLFSISDQSIQVIKKSYETTNGYELIIPQALVATCTERLLAAGAEKHSEDLLETIRITSGTPRFGIDVTEKNIVGDFPLETYVSFTKGCYAGQEVVERLVALGRANKRFVRLEYRADEAIEPKTELKLTGDSKVGYITSSIALPESGMFRALGYIKASTTDSSLQAGETEVNVLDM